MKYQLLYKPAEMTGHKIYRNTVTGEIEVADWSGTTPDRTDDGSIVVRRGAECEIVLSRGVLVAFVDTKTGDRNTRIITDLETAAELLRHAFLRVKLSPDAATLQRSLERLVASSRQKDKSLGRRQKSMLNALNEMGGEWHENCGWVWDEPSKTKKLLESLSKRGYVNRVEQKGVTKYILNRSMYEGDVK